MATIIPAAKSPRIDKNVLKWYYGDTFLINWKICLKEDGEPRPYLPEDKIIFSFYIPNTTRCIHVFTFTNITNDTVHLEFSEEISKKFIPGKYVYSIKFVSASGTIKTLGAANQAEVEKCC